MTEVAKPGPAAQSSRSAGLTIAPTEPHLTILVPVLNDAESLCRLLGELVPTLDTRVELLVIDGGSSDDSIAVARSCHANVIEGTRGRGAQLALGSAQALGRWIWMLHADSSPTPACIGYLLRLDDRPSWGRFSVRIDGGPLLAVVAWTMNRRSCLTGICTGDQGIFVHRELLRAAGGVPAQPLMEDIELSRRLKKLGWPLCRGESIATSPRRWLANGIVRTILSMWRFRLRYWRGEDVERLAREYYR